MSKTLHVDRRAIVLRSSAIALVIASLGLLVLADGRPTLIEPVEQGFFAVGLRLKQYSPVSRIPAWLTLPDRSTAPYGNLAYQAATKRLFFRTFSSNHMVEQHYCKLLSNNGFQVAVIRPQNSEGGIATIIDAYDPASGRSAQIVIRDVRAVRAIEITYDARVQTAKA